MRWDDFRRSDNVEDDRGGGGGFGGGGGLPMGGGGLGIGAIVVLSLVGWAFGIDPSILIGGAEMVNGSRTQQSQPYQEPTRQSGPTAKPTDKMGDFVSAVLGNTEDVWTKVFQESNQQYRAPRLRLFAGQVDSGCGGASAASGPFYCPNDRRIYIDTSFFREIENRFRGCSGKACEFAQAYVLAHEVGHHVQKSLGILDKAREAQQSAGGRTAAANRIQVQVELQADCFAGIWANQSNQRWKSVEPGDVEAALQTAAAIGDDTLQKRAGRAVVPDSFTHGSAAQRQRWFDAGFKSGKVSACNTFAAGGQL